jgi:hypothetical protein
MKDTLPRRLAYRALQWWRDMVDDLIGAEERVLVTAERLHRIAGRTHVLEMEAYGDTKPRHTNLPAPPS